MADPPIPLSPIDPSSFDQMFADAHRPPQNDASPWRRRFLNFMFFWRTDEIAEDLNMIKLATELITTALSRYPNPIISHGKSAPRVLKILWKAFTTGKYEELSGMQNEEAQIALNILQELFDRPDLGSSSQVVNHAALGVARRLLLRRLQVLACLTLQLPFRAFVQGLTFETTQTQGYGGFADIYRGELGGGRVAVKHLRVFNSANPPEQPKDKKLFYREAILWFNLNHKHILKFKGISKDVQLPGLCMVLQWAEHSDIRHYLDKLVIDVGLSGQSFVAKVNKWLYQVALGLEYLHSNGVAHSDLRGVNILVDSNESILLADLGLSVISNVGNSFTEQFEAKSCAWMAPELLEPGPLEPESVESELLDPQATPGPQRPTAASDMYSFGCVCVELYANAAPYGDMKEYEIICKVISGKGPQRPQTPGRELEDVLWEFVNSCWKSPKKRPTATGAVGFFRDRVPLGEPGA